MGDSSRGPLCMVDNPVITQSGLMSLSPHPAPGVRREIEGGTDSRGLENALKAFQSQAEIFAWRYINDASARRAYVARISKASQQILADVRSGVVSAADGARFANQARNLIMEETRAITSAIGRAGAEASKSVGLTLEEAIGKAVTKHFPGQSFGSLNNVQKRQIFTEVIDASGRSSPKVTSKIPRWTRFGRGLAIVTVAISVYNVWQAENKVRQGIKEGATVAGGALGGAVATASAGFVCGPGAPVCVTVLFVVGGIAGSLVANSAADYALDQKEVVEWLGE